MSRVCTLLAVGHEDYFVNKVPVAKDIAISFWGKKEDSLIISAATGKKMRLFLFFLGRNEINVNSRCYEVSVVISHSY